MSMMPGNPCHKDADFPAPEIVFTKCRDCRTKIVLGSDIQGRCWECYDKWLDAFIGEVEYEKNI